MTQATGLTVDEGNLRFRFDSTVWDVVRWDRHPAYQRIEKLDRTKAVDFVALHRKKDLYFIEVKDYRSQKRAKEKGHIWIEVALKVRDTVAGLVAAARRGDSVAEELRPYVDALRSPDRHVWVVLWLEHSKGLEAASLGLDDRLKTYLKWLTSKVAVSSREGHRLHDVVVHSLPYAPVEA